MRGLFQHTGWKFLENELKQQKSNLYAQFRTIDPNDKVKVAKLQAKLSFIEKLLNKPQKYLKK